MKHVQTFGEVFENLAPLSAEAAKATDHGEEGYLMDTESSEIFNYSFVPKGMGTPPGGFLITTKESKPFITDYGNKKTQIHVTGIDQSACEVLIDMTKKLSTIEEALHLLQDVVIFLDPKLMNIEEL